MKLVKYLSLILLLLSCGEIRSGRVIEKGYVKPNTNLIMIPGKVFVTIPIYNQERWYITINNNNQLRTISVTNDFYENINIGDSVTYLNQNRIWQRTMR